MAGVAIKLGMNFIQLKPGDGMLEILLIPSGVAIGAHAVQLGDPLAGRVTGPAVERGMIRIERPAGPIVRETGPLSGIVTFGTGIACMAIVTDGVNLFLCLLDLRRALLGRDSSRNFPGDDNRRTGSRTDRYVLYAGK